MGDVKDALVYSQLTNNLNSSVMGDTQWDTLLNDLNVDRTQISSQLNDILSNTTVKRACCMKNPTSSDDPFINVRIPIPMGYTVSDDNKTWKEFGYIDKRVVVPKAMCDTQYTKGSEKCDQFYKLYCENAKAFFMEENGGKFDQAKFSSYKPDCACYGPKPPYITGSVAPGCYLAGCDANSQGVYPDYLTRKGCDAKFCIQNVDFTKMNVGGDASINSVLENKCADQYAQSKAPAPAPPAPRQPSPSPSPTPPSPTPPSPTPPSSPSTPPSSPSTPPSSPSTPPSSPSTSPSSPSTPPSSPSTPLSSPSTPPSPSPTPPFDSTDIGTKIKTSFTGDGNYIGWIVVGVLLLLIICCIYSIARKK